MSRPGRRWFCDWPVFVEEYFGKDPALGGWRLVDSRDEFRLYHRPSP